MLSFKLLAEIAPPEGVLTYASAIATLAPGNWLEMAYQASSTKFVKTAGGPL